MQRRDFRVSLGYTLMKSGERERGLELVRGARDEALLEIRSGSEARWERYTAASAYAVLGNRRAA